MPRPKNILVSCMGTVFSMSPNKYRQLLTDIANDNQPNFSLYGKEVGIIHRNVTDMSAEEAKLELGMQVDEELLVTNDDDGI